MENEESKAKAATYWLVFSQDTPSDVAVRRFMEKYGYEPKQVLRRPPHLLFVGPIKKEDVDNEREQV